MGVTSLTTPAAERIFYVSFVPNAEVGDPQSESAQR